MMSLWQMAQAGEVDRDLAGARRIERDLFDDQRFPNARQTAAFILRLQRVLRPCPRTDRPER